MGQKNRLNPDLWFYSCKRSCKDIKQWNHFEWTVFIQDYNYTEEKSAVRSILIFVVFHNKKGLVQDFWSLLHWVICFFFFLLISKIFKIILAMIVVIFSHPEAGWFFFFYPFLWCPLMNRIFKYSGSLCYHSFPLWVIFIVFSLKRLCLFQVHGHILWSSSVSCIIKENVQMADTPWKMLRIITHQENKWKL